MARYQYSIVRCVPEPRTGEFINVGVIAGSAEEGDWDARTIQSFRRANKLCGSDQLGAATRFIAEITALFSAAEESSDPLPESWLGQLWSEKRNVVQLSEPQVAVGETASEVLDFICASQLIDLASAPREFIDKYSLTRTFNRELANRKLPPGSVVLRRPALVIGDRLRTSLDFAFGYQNQSVQITQAWSFQRGTVNDLATEVMAWGYALRRVQDGELKARIEGRDGSFDVDPKLPLAVLYAEPRTPHQVEVFEEAQEVFNKLGVERYAAGQTVKLVEDVTHRMGSLAGL